MSVRQRVLRSAPLVAFALAIVFLGLSLGGYDPADPPGWGPIRPTTRPPIPADPSARSSPTSCSSVWAGRRGCCCWGWRSSMSC